MRARLAQAPRAPVHTMSPSRPGVCGGAEWVAEYRLHGATGVNWLKRMLRADAAAPATVHGASAPPAAAPPGPAEAGSVEERYRATDALMQAEDYEAARAALEALAAEAPEGSAIHYRLGYVQRQMGEVAAAIESYRRALALKPLSGDIRSELLLTLNYSAEHGAAEVFEEHRRYGAQQVQPVGPPAPDPAWPRRLRVGYLSPDLRSHVVTCFSLPVIARHDRGRFEVFCYHCGTEADAVTQGLRSLADGWLDCAALSDEQLCERIRADRIDILVDLAGHTANHRLGVLARRAAPLQATWIGYPNTTGLRAVDYRITDAVADPPGAADALHVERLLRLPRGFLCYRPGPALAPGPRLPQAAPEEIVFGCFNNFQKLSEPFFGAAARLLEAVPRSRLLLKAKPLMFPSVAARVRERFAAAGIDPARLVLRGWEKSVTDHLAAYGAVDIALDSFPYNGTTTTCEALWMGVPVVTVAGDRHAARVGASLLHAVGLEELVARDPHDFVRIAAALAAAPSRLAALRAGMRERLQRSPLMDEAGFVADLERAYVQAWQERLRAAPEPDDDAAIEQLARDCNASGDHARAVDRLGAALARRGPQPRLHYLLGCALEDLGRAHEAMAQYRAALALDPGAAKAANNLGALLEIEGRLAEAAAQYEAAFAADPGLDTALLNLANLHKRLGDPHKAAHWIRRSIERDPRNPEPYASLAECDVLVWKLDEAEQTVRAALAFAPDSARLHFALGNALQGLARAEEAEQCFRKVLQLQPSMEAAWTNLLFALHYHKGDDAALLEREHRAWAAALPALPVPPPARPATGPRRLRIGYLSPNFHRHSVAYFIEPLLGAHDRSAFRVYGYANVQAPDKVTQRLRHLCDEWRDIYDLGDEAVAERIRADRIDILVDLAGHTAGGRLGVFMRRPAPLQVTWLGYPDTTGLPAIGWRLSDARADPPGEADRLCTEKLYRLPRGFLCYGPAEDAPPVVMTPAAARGYVTFGSFNNLAKVGEATRELWARILAALPGARMLVKAPGLRNPSAQRALLAAFARHGVAAERIDIEGLVPSPSGHLERYGTVDIALDTYPYHGTTTTCEALWMGLPVITLAGPTHVSRVGASLLGQVGLEELVAHSPGEYVQLAVALGRDVARIRALREGMRARLRASPLLDTRGFARDLELAYRRMWAEATGAEMALPPRGGREPLRLHLGGRQPREGWKILNAQPGPGVDFVGDCADLSRFAEGSVREVYASHVLEHLGYQQALPRALAEIHRALEPGGRAFISVPDFDVVCRLFTDPRRTPHERFQLMRIAFGGQVDAWDFHYVGLNGEFLNDYLRRAGFAAVERVDGFGLFEDTSTLRVLGEPVSLNVIARKRG